MVGCGARTGLMRTFAGCFPRRCELLRLWNLGMILICVVGNGLLTACAWAAIKPEAR